MNTPQSWGLRVLVRLKNEAGSSASNLDLLTCGAVFHLIPLDPALVCQWHGVDMV